MLVKLFCGAIIIYTAPSGVSSQDRSKLTFKDYLQQFKPSQVWRDIEESNKLKGLNKTFKDEFNNIIDNIDETDRLMSLKVRNGNPKTLDKDARRQFKPPGDVTDTAFDQFRLRARLVELMKQAIFQARNKMIIMQTLREKYNKISLYKMGFLVAKTDIACKTFSIFAYKIFRFCTMSRQFAAKEFTLLDNLIAKERLLDLWFDVDLLIDLVMLNHETCQRTLNQVVTNRKHAWKFVD